MYYAFIEYQDDVKSKLIEWGADVQEGSNEEDDSSSFVLNEYRYLCDLSCIVDNPKHFQQFLLQLARDY